MKILRQIFDDPLNFFKTQRKLRQGFLCMAFSLLTFLVLNQAMIRLGFLQNIEEITSLWSAAVNYFAMISGFFIITAVCYIPFCAVGGKKLHDLFTVTAYSIIPVAFFWIPHIVAQAIVIFLFAVIMTRGVAIHAGTSNRKAFIVTVCFIVLVVAGSLIVRNFILLPGKI